MQAVATPAGRGDVSQLAPVPPKAPALAHLPPGRDRSDAEALVADAREHAEQLTLRRRTAGDCPSPIQDREGALIHQPDVGWQLPPW